MVSLKRTSRGFTIVELLIVIVVIGILAALVIITYTGIQQKARNTERKTDVNAIHGHLEAYYAQNGSYPAMADVNDGTFRSANMKGLDPGALKDPSGATQALCASASANCYGYAPTPALCTSAADDCIAYTLTANLEGEDPYVKTSLN